jgi:H/ACA ribonucleoprotein complex subunit 3
MFHILRCSKCKSYGLEPKCSCGGSRSKPKPPKYSPEDKYGEYRRKYKEEHENDEENRTDDTKDDKSEGSDD